MNQVVEVIGERAPLSKREIDRLKELESVIHRNLSAVFEVGAALAEIQRDNLHRATHLTFEAYVKDIFDIGKSRSYQLLNGWQAREDVKAWLLEYAEAKDALQSEYPNMLEAKVHNCGLLDLLPENEAQVRPLTLLSTPKERAEAWAEAVNIGLSYGGRVTAKHVTKAVNNLRGIASGAKLTNARKTIDHASKCSADFAAASHTLLDIVQHEIDTGFKSTSRAAIAAFCRSILDLVEAV